MIETKTWYDFYKNKCNESYYNYICVQYKDFINEIYNNMKPFMNIGEFGCGIGNITKVLMCVQPNNNYTLIDNSNLILDLVEQHLDTLHINIDCWDILNKYPAKFDLIHSHGVLEHFEDYEIHKILENQKSIAPLLIHYVPSNKYEYKSFGDERLLSKEEWKEKFSPSEIIEFNDGYDLILKWRK